VREDDSALRNGQRTICAEAPSRPWPGSALLANHRTTTKAGVTLGAYAHHDYAEETRHALNQWAHHLTKIVASERTSSRRGQAMASVPDSIDDLLDLARITKTPETRSELDQAFEIARGTYEYERQHQERAPSEPFEQLDASIRKTVMLIEKLGKYPDTRDIAFEQHPIGTGIADAAAGRKIVEGRNLRVSRRPWVDKGWREVFPMDDIIVGINVENLLRAFRIHVGEARRNNKRGQPKRADKSSVVFYPADFFRAYSAIKPSTDEKNPFRCFVERFFEIATGTKPPDLEWQIRQALGNYPDPRIGKFSYGNGGGEKQPKKDD
jgi:hypothetical protein